MLQAITQPLIGTVWLIPIYSLIGAALSIIWTPTITRRTGPRPAGYVNLAMTLLSFLHGLGALLSIWGEPTLHLQIKWFSVSGLDFLIPLEISSLTVGATVLVTGLNFLAQVYAVGYLEMDWGWARFYALLAFFEAGMCALAFTDSLFISYVILELLTLGTYLLVGMWYNQPLVITGARDAFLTKRIGDLFLLMGVVALLPLAGTWNFDELAEWASTNTVNPTVITLVGLALLAGPMGKCAQFPLHLWLDEAMEGPNPASILRNSVVVACGAYVLVKLQPILVLSPVASTVLVVLGTMTAIGASLVALAQIDIKRALAHSTSAYLGLVFIAVGTQWTNVAFYILFAHAIAKALLFMSTGAIIVTTSTQDITEMGGLWSRMPATTTAYLVGATGLVGLLPLGGFWALREGVDIYWYDSPWLVAILLLVNTLTAINLTRVFRLVFLGPPQVKTRRAPEVPWLMAVPLVSLSVTTLLVPLMLQRLYLLPDWDYINWATVLLIVLSGGIGCLVGVNLRLSRVWVRPIQAPLKFFQDLLSYDFYVQRLYEVTVVWSVSTLSRLSAWFDRYVLDGFVNLVGFASIFGGESLKYSISGQSQFYLLTILIGISVFGALLTFLTR